MRFAITATVEPPTDQVFLAQSGGSIFFCGYSKWRNQFELIYPGGSEKINPPEMIYLDEEYIKEHRKLGFIPPTQPRLRRSKKPQQMELL